ncbi:MAG: HAD family phosphatase [Rikenellaceae bacterium]
MGAIKGVLFDMDGVLVDNMNIHVVAFDQICVKYGVEPFGNRLYEFSGMSNADIIRDLFPADVVAQLGVAALSMEKEALYRQIYAATIEPVKGLREFLAELKAQGVKCAVGSSGVKENVEFVLEACGIADYFSALVYSDIVTRCKPDPEIYLTAAKLLDLEPSECAVFEDALAGIESARNANVARVIALSTSHSAEELSQKGSPDEIITDYTQILGREW